MKIYRKTEKNTSGFGYWGNFGEIDLGWSSGLIEDNDKFPGEKLHYHTVGTTYFLGITGAGLIQVEGNEIELSEDVLLRIDPREKYGVVGAKTVPFKWIVVCTSKEKGEKVEVE